MAIYDLYFTDPEVLSRNLPLTIYERFISDQGFWLRVGGVETEFHFLADFFSNGQCVAIKPIQFEPQGLFFDMDGTLIEEESLVAIAKELGLENEMQIATDKAMAYGLDFATSVRERVKWLADCPLATIETVAQNVTQKPYAKDLIAHGLTQACPSFLITGGFTHMAAPLATSLHIKEYRANLFDIKDHKLTGIIMGDIVDAPGKANQLKLWAKRYQIPMEKTVAIGDGANDIPMFEAASLALGVAAKPITFPHLDGYFSGLNAYAHMLEFLFFSPPFRQKNIAEV